MHITLLAALLAATSASQLPIEMNLKNPGVKLHYSTVEKGSLPIDLYQYTDNIVVRARRTPELVRFLKHGQFSIWAQHGAENAVDFQLPAMSASHVLLRFALLEARVLINDLAQTVYELYPSDFTGGDFSEYSAKCTKEFREYIELLPVTMSKKERFKAASQLFFKLYRPFDVILDWLNMLAQTYVDIINLEEIGKTFEKRPLGIIHFSVPSDIPEEKKRTVVITGGVHAREWVSVSSVLYTIYEMILHYESRRDDLEELANLNFLFIPTLNPDGYEYTWSTDRLWRKNRQMASISENNSCRGIDIDHSFDYHWSESSDDICGEDYAGSKPFEAYELQLWKDYLNRTNSNHNIWGYVDLHSYSQEVLYPYAFSCNQQPRDEENLIELGFGIAKSIRLMSGKYYAVLRACIDKDLDNLPDLGSGLALDYMYHHRSYWAYQIKLRDTGAHGFLLPEKYIQPVGEEISTGIKYFSKFILDHD